MLIQLFRAHVGKKTSVSCETITAISYISRMLTNRMISIKSGSCYTAATTMKHIYQLKSTDRLMILGFTRQKSKMAAIFCLAQTSASFLSHFHVKTMWYKFFVAFKDHLIWHTFSRFKAMWHITRVLSYVKTMWFRKRELIGISRSHAQICDCWLVLIFVEFWIISVSACLLFPKFGRELFLKLKLNWNLDRTHKSVITD